MEVRVLRALRLTEEQYAQLVQKSGAFTEREQPRKLNKGRRWEDEFARQLDLSGIHYEREFKFMADRRFRFDFRITGSRIAVEIDGVVHRIANRFTEDRKKFQLAALYGWRVLRVGSDQVRSGEALGLLKRML